MRTKEAVRHVDHQNFKRLQKMLMGNDEGEDTISEDIESEPPRCVVMKNMTIDSLYL